MLFTLKEIELRVGRDILRQTHKRLYRTIRGCERREEYDYDVLGLLNSLIHWIDRDLQELKLTRELKLTLAKKAHTPKRKAPSAVRRCWSRKK